MTPRQQRNASVVDARAHERRIDRVETLMDLLRSR